MNIVHENLQGEHNKIKTKKMIDIFALLFYLKKKKENIKIIKTRKIFIYT